MSSLNIDELLIIPDQVLETLICRLCDKYLTVGPISVHPEGGNICGRCHGKVNTTSQCLFECDSVVDLIEQVNIPYTIFGYVNHFFPCVNRYEGCSKLLAFDDISKHEILCQAKKIKCRCCNNYEGTGSQQLNHFRTKHPLNFFDKVYFRFPLNERYSTNLIKRGEDLFFLYFEINNEKEKIDFFVKPTSRYLDDDIDFFCLLKDPADGEIIDQTSLTKRKREGIYHSLLIKDKQYLGDFNLICECLLKRVSRKINKATLMTHKSTNVK
ncbi:hypothetical protein Zmor_007055 [Zophobas morio]|uniref:SIAH-type domain-containing protein n=1 Tax=Zophobas morio TaxID=2755281 RepID=A0AA38MPA9_9CUCU|nr:hypothetical protein Zmor_007055 [Zophobas morio]